MLNFLKKKIETNFLVYIDLSTTFSNYYTVKNHENKANFWVKVLSTGYEILFKTSWQDAMKDISVGRVEVVEFHPSLVIGTVRGTIPMPLSVRFKHGVFASALKFPKKTLPPTKKNIFARDMSHCQYCKKKLTLENASIDHVIPKSRGGKNVWENVVLSCVPCNTKKGSKTLEEIGFKLQSSPKTPPEGHAYSRYSYMESFE